MREGAGRITPSLHHPTPAGIVQQVLAASGWSSLRWACPAITSCPDGAFDAMPAPRRAGLCRAMHCRVAACGARPLPAVRIAVSPDPGADCYARARQFRTLGPCDFCLCWPPARPSRVGRSFPCRLEALRGREDGYRGNRPGAVRAHLRQHEMTAPARALIAHDSRTGYQAWLAEASRLSPGARLPYGAGLPCRR